jgi:lipoprotein signal peptidase
VGSLRTGVFNLADVSIVAGVAILLLLSLEPGGSRGEGGGSGADS